MFTEKFYLAVEIALKYHEGQEDKNGIPYFFHPMHVAEEVAKKTEDEDTAIVAVLHDVLEDTSCPPELILELFGEEIFHSLMLLTKKEGENYFDYIRRIENDPMARTVKIEDLRHNTDPTRFVHNPKSKDFDRSIKYYEALMMLVYGDHPN